MNIQFVNREDIVNYLLEKLYQDGSLTSDELSLLIGLTNN